MTNNVEELLREGIDRLTAGADIPAGLITRARRRNRRRRRAIWAAAAAGTAAVTAAAVIAASSTPQTSSGSLQEQTISYVTSRAQQALAGMTQANAIQVTEETASQPNDFGFYVLNMSPSGGTGVHSGVLAGVHADRMTDWTSTGLLLQQGFSADGKLIFAASIGYVTSRPGNGAAKKVQEADGAAYLAHIQWHSPLVGPDGPAPPLTCDNAMAGGGSGNFRAQISKALSCHLYTLAGHQEINGVSTIKLVLKPQPGLGIEQTLWIDPSSYLPIRAVVSFVQTHTKTVVLTHNYQWLPRTAANLAALRAAIRQSAIPSTFRSLPADDLPLPGLNGLSNG
jgi:hypothetical protein